MNDMHIKGDIFVHIRLTLCIKMIYFNAEGRLDYAYI